MNTYAQVAVNQILSLNFIQQEKKRKGKSTILEHEKLCTSMPSEERESIIQSERLCLSERLGTVEDEG